MRPVNNTIAAWKASLPVGLIHKVNLDTYIRVDLIIYEPLIRIFREFR